MKFKKFLNEELITIHEEEMQYAMFSGTICEDCIDKYVMSKYPELFEKELNEEYSPEHRQAIKNLAIPFLPGSKKYEKALTDARKNGILPPEDTQEKYGRVRGYLYNKIENAYGPATQQENKNVVLHRLGNPEGVNSIATHEEIEANSHHVIKNFLALENSEHESDRKMAADMLTNARKRRKVGGFGNHFDANAKNETANEVEHNGKENIVVGMSGMPSHFDYIHTDHKGEKTTTPVTTCPHGTTACRGCEATGKKGSCLAMSGQGTQATTIAQRSHYEQGAMDPRTRNDHALTLFDDLRKLRDKAHAEGKNGVMRLNNYSEHNTGRWSSMIQHFVNAPKKDKNGNHVAPLIQYNYTKNPNDKNDPDNGIHFTFSDMGPSVRPKYDERGKIVGHEFSHESHVRDKDRIKATTQSDSNSHPMNQYSVINLRRPNEDDLKENKPIAQKWNNFQNNLKTWRHWSPEVGKEEEGDDKSGNAVHHEDGHGYQYIKHPDGTMRKHTYQDLTIIRDKDGKLPKHDARFTEQGLGKTKNKEGKQLGGVVVSSAVKSTSNKKLRESEMFHDANNLDEHGVFHVNHPHQIIAANQQAGEQFARKLSGKNEVSESIIDLLIKKKIG